MLSQGVHQLSEGGARFAMLVRVPREVLERAVSGGAPLTLSVRRGSGSPRASTVLGSASLKAGGEEVSSLVWTDEKAGTADAYAFSPSGTLSRLGGLRRRLTHSQPSRSPAAPPAGAARKRGRGQAKQPVRPPSPVATVGPPPREVRVPRRRPAAAAASAADEAAAERARAARAEAARVLREKEGAAAARAEGPRRKRPRAQSDVAAAASRESRVSGPLRMLAYGLADTGALPAKRSESRSGDDDDEDEEAALVARGEEYARRHACRKQLEEALAENAALFHELGRKQAATRNDDKRARLAEQIGELYEARRVQVGAMLRAYNELHEELESMARALEHAV